MKLSPLEIIDLMKRRLDEYILHCVPTIKPGAEDPRPAVAQRILEAAQELKDWHHEL